MGAWALGPFVKPIHPISMFGRSNFLPSFSAYVYVFSIVWSVGTPHKCARCSDAMLLIVQGRYALTTQLHCASSALLVEFPVYQDNKTTMIWNACHEGCIWIWLGEVLWISRISRIKTQSIVQLHSCLRLVSIFIFEWINVHIIY